MTHNWQPIETAPLEVSRFGKRVDLWLRIYASPRSFGMGDSFRVVDCWREGNKWFHDHEGKPAELYADYITHWMPMPEEPAATPKATGESGKALPKDG